MRNSGILVSKVFPIVYDSVFTQLFRTQDSLIYANSDASKYSLVKINEDYMTYVDGIETKYPGFTLDRNNLVISRSPSNMDLDFEHLKEILLYPQKLSYDHDQLFR